MKDFLTKTGNCSIADKFISNKKVIYCKKCIRAIQCDNGTVCTLLLDEKY